MNLGFGLVFSSSTGGAERGIGRVGSALGNLAGMAASLGDQFKDTFRDLGEFLVGTGASMVQVAASFETSERMLRFAFRDLKSEQAKDNIMEQVELSGLKTMQTTREVMDMVIDIKRMSNINLFDPRMPKVVDATGKEVTNMATLLADVAAGSEFGMRSVKKGLMGMMAGNWGRVAMNLDPIAGKIDEYKRAIGNAKTETEKFIAVAPLLARDFGGAADGLKNTWGFYVSQVSDVKEKLLRTFGKPMMDALKPGLASLVSYFTGPDGLLLPSNIRRLDGIRDAFGDIGRAVSNAVSVVGPFVRRVGEFAMQHPNVVKVAAAFVAVAAAGAGVVAVIIAVKVAVAAVSFAMAGLFTVALPVVAIAVSYTHLTLPTSDLV